MKQENFIRSEVVMWIIKVYTGKTDRLRGPDYCWALSSMGFQRRKGLNTVSILILIDRACHIFHLPIVYPPSHNASDFNYMYTQYAQAKDSK